MACDSKLSAVTDVRLLGINLTSKPRWVQLLYCSGGFFFGYIVNGLAEEYVYNKAGFRQVSSAAIDLSGT